ncbi:hypothetical protein [Nocardiopsis prasina]|uniref:hypothetical protein n=1 Tax=Nocardiopsis prasina TaxID=2015 RepID=UPI0003453E06|nr:hypothetical protein [Nocardiopsis prasina]
MNFTHQVWVRLSSLALPRAERSSDRGAGFVEYGAILVFVGLVAMVLMGSGIADTIVQGISRTIRTTLTPP